MSKIFRNIQIKLNLVSSEKTFKNNYKTLIDISCNRQNFVEKRTSQIDLQKSVKTLQSFINFLLFVEVSFSICKSTFNIFNSFIWNFKIQLFRLVKNQLLLQGRLQPFDKNKQMRIKSSHIFNFKNHKQILIRGPLKVLNDSILIVNKSEWQVWYF